MSVDFYREPPGKFDSRTLSRKTLNRWTGRIGFPFILCICINIVFSNIVVLCMLSNIAFGCCLVSLYVVILVVICCLFVRYSLLFIVAHCLFCF